MGVQETLVDGKRTEDPLPRSREATTTPVAAALRLSCARFAELHPHRTNAPDLHSGNFNRSKFAQEVWLALLV